MKYLLFGVSKATKMLSENSLKNLLCALVSRKWRYLPEGNYVKFYPSF